MRVVVFGNSGAGKSSYAKSVAEAHSIPHLDLDSVVWEPGQVAVPRPAEAAASSVMAFISSEPAWVIEGCYGELVQLAAAHCSQLVFLNPGVDACLANNLKRPLEIHKYGSIEEQNAMLPVLQEWVKGYYSRLDSWSYAAHRRIFDTHAGAKIEHAGQAYP